MISQETIVALASPSGAGAIAVIRLSGSEALTLAEQVFQSVSGKSISKQKTQQYQVVPFHFQPQALLHHHL